MSPRQVRIDDLEIIPGVIKATATYVFPDTSEVMGPTVEIVMHIKKADRDYRQISEEAVREAERILRQILEID
jgi:hypothetical protein